MVFKWKLKACVFGLVALLLCIQDGAMTPDVAEGLVLWALLFYAAWKMRKAQRLQPEEGATPSTERVKVTQMGPAWEQDAPYPEAFDEEDDV